MSNRPRWAVRLAYIAGAGDPRKLGDVDTETRAQLRAEIYMAQLRLERARASVQGDGPDERIAAQVLAILERAAAQQGLEPWASGVQSAG